MRHHRPFIAQDNVGRPCSCLDCQMAGATHLPSVKVPPDEFHDRSRWLHGDELKAWWTAKDAAMAQLQALREKLTMPGSKGAA